MLKKVCDVIKQFIFKSIVRKCRIENFKTRKYKKHCQNKKEKSILLMKQMQIRTDFRAKKMIQIFE